MKNNNVLIINGRHYDALTGQLINPSDQTTPKTRSIDGFQPVKKSRPAADSQLNASEQSIDSSNQSVIQHQKTGRAHDIVVSRSMHSTLTTKPLMRIGLKKPSRTVKPISKLQAPIISKQPVAKLHTHRSAALIPRTEGIHRSNQVKHFSKHHSSESSLWGSSPSAQPSSSSIANIIDPVTSQTNKLQNVIDRGLQKASSHDQPNPSNKSRRHKPKRSKLKVFNIVVGVLALLLIISFVIARNIPGIDVRIASARSGVQAEIPTYIPAGFRFLAPIKYGQGTVTVIFASGNKSFRIVQQNSSWDSLSLRDSFVSIIDPNYKIVQAGGRLVYLYGQANATWVNQGIWYQITDNANLTTASLLKIATSL